MAVKFQMMQPVVHYNGVPHPINLDQYPEYTRLLPTAEPAPNFHGYTYPSDARLDLFETQEELHSDNTMCLAIIRHIRDMKFGGTLEERIVGAMVIAEWHHRIACNHERMATLLKKGGIR